MATWPEIAGRAAEECFRTFGQPATYVPSGGPAISVTLILKTPEGELDGFGIGARRLGRVADVRAAEVTSPAEGDILVIGTETFTVRGAKPDTERLVWTLDLDPQE